jgi:hypothetical protein
MSNIRLIFSLDGLVAKKGGGTNEITDTVFRGFFL